MKKLLLISLFALALTSNVSASANKGFKYSVILAGTGLCVWYATKSIYNWYHRPSQEERRRLQAQAAEQRATAAAAATEVQQEDGVWTCQFCTFVNVPNTDICEVCNKGPADQREALIRSATESRARIPQAPIEATTSAEAASAAAATETSAPQESGDELMARAIAHQAQVNKLLTERAAQTEEQRELPSGEERRKLFASQAEARRSAGT